jgi:signal recognition particle subunit SRP54
MLDKLGSSLKNTLSKIAKSVFVDEKLVNELIKDIQRALLQSDVNVQLVFKLTENIKTRALKEEIKAISKKEHLITIVYEELVRFLGEAQKEIKIDKSKIMLVGLFGNGKTTTAGKLAKYYKKRGHKIALVQLDVYRPAAFDQLQQLGKSIDVPVYGNKYEKDPVKIYESFEEKLKQYDLVIVDTAGRDALSEDLIEEINKLNEKIKPQDTFLVMNGDMGQAAQKQAEAFNSACNVTGVIITKLEGTSKGGGALSACSVTNSPVVFIGVGEKVDDLEVFDPKRFVSRLLGMGDIESLLEKAKDAMSEEDAKDMQKKLLKGEFNLVDLYSQMESMSKMGPLSKIVDMIPGFGQMKIPKDALQVQEGKLKKWKFIMNSCTKEELENPDVISGNRIERIAKGSGTSVEEVRGLLKQYKQSKKMVKMLKGGKNMDKLMKKMGGKMPM